MELAKIGVFSGMGEGRFGVEAPALAAQIVAVIARAVDAADLEPSAKANKVMLPEALRDKWWSDNLQDLAERGVITADELAHFDPSGAPDEATLRAWLNRAFPGTAGRDGPVAGNAAAGLPELPPELRPVVGLTRGAVAYLLWEAIKGDVSE